MRHIDPAKDGIDHINMYSKSNTQFGRMLSNFYACPIETQYEGKFLSVEGYWYWLSLPSSFCERERLRRLHGFLAKSTGRQLRDACQVKGIDLRFDPKFENKILTAIQCKLNIEKRLFLPEYKDLPIYHYYVFNGKVKDVTDDFPWLINGVSKLVAETYRQLP